MDVNSKLRRLMDAKGWTMYRLAKESGLSQNTVINIFRRNTVPSIDTLESICKKGFGITLSNFFAEENESEMTPEWKSLYEVWLLLSSDQKALLQQIAEEFGR